MAGLSKAVKTIGVCTTAACEEHMHVMKKRDKQVHENNPSPAPKQERGMRGRLEDPQISGCPVLNSNIEKHELHMF